MFVQGIENGKGQRICGAIIMSHLSLFREYWEQFQYSTLQEREKYFNSLSPADQRHLIRSFFEEGWHEVFIRNIIDEHLDFIKDTYYIDLIDLRIKSLKGRVFLVDKKVWDHIEELIFPYDEYIDTDIFFGGLAVMSWGKKRQFYRIRSKQGV